MNTNEQFLEMQARALNAIYGAFAPVKDNVIDGDSKTVGGNSWDKVKLSELEN